MARKISGSQTDDTSGGGNGMTKPINHQSMTKPTKPAIAATIIEPIVRSRVRLERDARRYPTMTATRLPPKIDSASSFPDPEFVSVVAPVVLASELFGAPQGIRCAVTCIMHGLVGKSKNGCAHPRRSSPCLLRFSVTPEKPVVQVSSTSFLDLTCQKEARLRPIVFTWAGGMRRIRNSSFSKPSVP